MKTVTITTTTEISYTTHNDEKIDINGTSLRGYVDCSYKELVAAFGKPNRGDEYKVDAEWVIKFNDGLVATIYNYKDGKNYMGKEGTATTKIRDWHIGGKDKAVLERIGRILGKPTSGGY